MQFWGETYTIDAWGNLTNRSGVSGKTYTEPLSAAALVNNYCTTPVAQNYKFTGKERDNESGLDNFGKRYDASSLGRFMTTDPTGEILQCADSTDQKKQCFTDLQQIAGDAANRLSMDAKTGMINFDTTDLDLSKNEGAALVNDLVSSKNTYEFSEGPTVQTANGSQKVDFITNLPTFGDQRQIGQPRAGVNDVVALFLNNPKITQVSNTNLNVALGYTVAFHELAEAFAKIDGGKGGSYEQGHNAALLRESTLRDQRPYLKEYNTGAGGPANSPNPQGGIVIKK